MISWKWTCFDHYVPHIQWLQWVPKRRQKLFNWKINYLICGQNMLLDISSPEQCVVRNIGSAGFAYLNWRILVKTARLREHYQSFTPRLQAVQTWHHASFITPGVLLYRTAYTILLTSIHEKYAHKSKYEIPLKRWRLLLIKQHFDHTWWTDDPAHKTGTLYKCGSTYVYAWKEKHLVLYFRSSEGKESLKIVT